MIAAYIGKQNAVNVLAEMTRRQEFIFGGFYTGIATLSDRRLSRKRVVGSLSHLESELQVQELAGNVGLAHSRTNDAGGIEWSQPRFDHEATIATVGVGIGGVFKPGESTRCLAADLLAKGVNFRTRTETGKKNGITLPDGSTVHGGEVYLLGLAERYREAGKLLTAVRDLNIRSESVGLYLCTSEPGTIFIVNHNQRVLVADIDGEMFIATSRLAFLGQPRWLLEIPVNTFATVTAEGVELEPLWHDEPRFDTSVPPDAAAYFVKFVRDTPGTAWYDAVGNSLDPLLPAGKATMSQILGHQLLEQCLFSRALEYKIQSVRGSDGQTGIPQMMLFSTN